MKRLDILRASLAKKKALFDEKLADHFNTVKSANGQPLNDKRDGHQTLKKWDNQNNALRNLQAGIEKTERAIDREVGRIELKKSNAANIPELLKPLVSEGVLIQWQKYPDRFFVKGVKKARIIWDSKNRVLKHQYVGSIVSKEEEYSTFRDVFNALNAELRKEAA